MAKATAIREKEAAAFNKEMAQDKTNLDSLFKAIAAIEKGLAGSFLQTNAAVILRNLVMKKVEMMENDRDDLLDFLQGSQNDESPGSAEIVGILKQMGDEMNKDLAELIKTE